MNDFSTLAAPLRVLMILWMNGLFLLFVYVAVRQMQLKSSPAPQLASILPLIPLIGFYAAMIRHHRRPVISVFITVPIVLAVLLLLSLLAAALLISLHRRTTRSINTETVAETIDYLSSGVCYYWPEGMPKLINLQMENVCCEMTGERMTDAAEFWKKLETGDASLHAACLEKGEEPIYRLDDGRVFSFRSQPVLFEGHPLRELLASEISEEYAIRVRLEEKQARASEVNQRLQHLTDSIIAKMTAEKEILTAKIRLHDSFGRSLLMLRNYLNDPQHQDGEKSIAACLATIRPMRTGQKESEADLLKRVEDFGVKIVMDSDISRPSVYYELIASAILTVALNTRQHANGDTVFIHVEETNTELCLCFKNNGTAPESAVHEGGGLGNLRRQTEALGGKMQIHTDPAFCLELRLPLPEQAAPTAAIPQSRADSSGSRAPADTRPD